MQGVVSEQESSFQLKATNLSSAGWLDDLTGEEYQFNGINVDVSLQGLLSSPQVKVSSQIGGVSCPQLPEPLSGRVNFSYTGNEGFTVNEFLLKTIHEQYISVTGHIPFDPLAKDKFVSAPFSLSGNIMLPGLLGVVRGSETQEEIEGALTGEFQFSGSLARPEGKMRLRGTHFFLHHFLKTAPREPITFDSSINVLPGRIDLEVLNVQSTLFSIVMDGSWSDIPSFPDLLFDTAGEIPGVVSFSGNLSMADANWLSPYLAGVRRLSGNIESSFTAKGPASAPVFSGELRLSEGNLRLTSLTLPPLSNITLHAYLKDNEVHLEEMNGRMGGAPVQVTGSYLFKGAQGPEINCKLSGSNVLVYRDDTMKIRADADLILNGPLSRLNLSGELTLTDSRFTKNVDFLSLMRGNTRPKAEIGMQIFSFEEPPLSDMTFDVKVTASAPFLITNYMAKGSIRPAMKLAGTGEVPVFIGRIYVDQTRILVPAGRMIIESGIITFPENDPDHPTFDLKASSRLAGYDISLHLQGSSETPIVTLSSDPPLPHDELLLLVLTGTLPQSDTDRKSAANMKIAPTTTPAGG